MRLIEPSAELLPQASGIFGMYNQIELAGKTCYKSTPQGGIEAGEFVQRMIQNGHTAMLEHGTVYMTIPKDIWNQDRHEWEYIFPEGCHWVDVNSDGNNIYVTTNYRHILEGEVGFKTMECFFTPSTPYHEPRYTARLITDRGITHELVRHRVFSFAQESSRYCNYGKKFGKEITFVKPYWYDQFNEPFVKEGLREDGTTDMFSTKDFEFFLEVAESNYMAALMAGMQPQGARAMLPNCVKSEIIMTGFQKDWVHFFDLRLRGTTGAPHPDMKRLATLLYAEFAKLGINL